MDILKIKTDFMRGLLSKLISKSISKKTGYKVSLTINMIEAHTISDDISFHADIEGNMRKEDFVKLLGLDE